MKGQILNILKTETSVVSGEILSARLGISRVAVWKHIKKLQEVGYNIEATPKGYLFISAPDALYPWEFEEKEYRVHYFDEVDSTMDIARKLAKTVPILRWWLPVARNKEGGGSKEPGCLHKEGFILQLLSDPKYRLF